MWDAAWYSSVMAGRWDFASCALSAGVLVAGRSRKTQTQMKQVWPLTLPALSTGLLLIVMAAFPVVQISIGESSSRFQGLRVLFKPQ